MPLVGPWDTRDRWVPWRLFWLLAGGVDSNMAFWRLNESQAVAKAIGLAFAGKDLRVQAVLGNDIKLADGVVRDG